MTTRRDFVKMSCGLCAALAGIGMASTLLQSCASVPVIKASPENQKINLPENSFGTENAIMVRSNKLEFDILVVKETTLVPFTYHAVLMRCSHQQQPLSFQGTRLHCSTHGSEFDLNGNVLKEPATATLTKYSVTANSGMLTIYLGV